MADLIAHSPIDHGFGWLKQWREQSHRCAYDRPSQIGLWLNFFHSMGLRISTQRRTQCSNGSEEKKLARKERTGLYFTLPQLGRWPNILVKVSNLLLALVCSVLISCLAAEAQNVTALPTSLFFGNQVEGTTSAAKKVSLKNGQSSAITVASISTSLSDYAATNNCPISPATLAAGASCTIWSVIFGSSILCNVTCFTYVLMVSLSCKINHGPHLIRP